MSIRLLISDVDGVLTDGSVWLDGAGNEIKRFHIHDGLGIKRLQQQGIIFAIISGRDCPAVTKRMQMLNVQHVYQGCGHDKIPALEHLLNQVQLPASAAAYVGDDLPDIAVMQRVGFGIAVANAVAEVKAQADWVTTLPGGQGAIREVCEHVLKMKNYVTQS